MGAARPRGSEGDQARFRPEGSAQPGEEGLARKLEEVPEDALPVRMVGVEALGVKLSSPPTPLGNGDGLNLAAGRACKYAESHREVGDFVPVVLKHDRPIREAGEKVAAIEHLERKIAELPRAAGGRHRLDLAAREAGEELKAGADPEDGRVCGTHDGAEPLEVHRLVRLPRGAGAAQDDGVRPEPLDVAVMDRLDRPSGHPLEKRPDLFIAPPSPGIELRLVLGDDKPDGAFHRPSEGIRPEERSTSESDSGDVVAGTSAQA